MNNEGLEHYLSFLTEKYSCTITIKDFIGFIPKSPELFAACDKYLIHRCDFCNYCKYEASLYNQCQKNTDYLRVKLGSINKPYIGRCYMGRYELMIPVKINGTLIASIGIGGFDYNRTASLHRIHHMAVKHQISEETLIRLHDSDLSSLVFDDIMIAQLIMQMDILVNFLQIYYKLLAAQGIISEIKYYSQSADRLYVIAKAIKYIQKNFSEKILVDDLAEYCGCSKSHLSHKFNQYMGYGLSAYITRIRIARAKELLVDSDKSLYEIANECGFCDSNYFSVVFKRSVDISPSEYRHSHQYLI
ncbi:MAG: helix-turn-helix domain-containing protein [Oscillospiraceae bacterium]